MGNHFTTAQRGMTLVELMVVLAMFTVLSLVITNSIASFYELNAYTIAQSYQVTEARRGMQYMVRDIREMTYSDDGSYPLASRGTSTIAFYSDIDRDDSVEFVEYELDGTTLYKKIYDASGSPVTYSSTPSQTITISRYVQNALQDKDVFAYSKTDGTPADAATTVTDIRYIGVNLIINIDPVRDPGEFMLRSSAALRNIIEYQS